MQNWSRGHFEATQKAPFSILKPNFWSSDTTVGVAHTGTTQIESTSKAISCKITILFGEILIFTSIVLRGFFLRFFKLGFLTFHNGIVTRHCLCRWQIYKRGYFHFQNSSMSAAFCISELSPNSIAKWNKYFRYICKNDYFKNRKLIGGEDCIVEIDETMCYSCTITNVCFDIVNFKNVFFYRTHVHMGSDHWVALSLSVFLYLYFSMSVWWPTWFWKMN